MDAATVVTFLQAIEQLVQIAVKQKALLDASDQASVDAALASLRATSDAIHTAAQSI